ncbi:MAG: YceI family protein [Bacteroidia bacterium]|nr:YceI family protein [Bacteroidia bacterium]MCZ2249063.1 YceI family protein [Bacteroidia bacterium]
MSTILWQLDPAHSEVQFKVKHMMMSRVTGEFKQFKLNVESIGHDFLTSKIHFEALINSIDTRVEQRDNHLKSADFFDAANYPILTFDSSEIVKINQEDYELKGNLTIRDFTHTISLKVISNGIIEDPYGNYRAGFEVSGSINRLEYGLQYNPIMEKGGLVVGHDVAISANIEIFYKK